MKLRRKPIVACLLVSYCIGCTLLINEPDEQNTPPYPYDASLISVIVDSTIIDSISQSNPYLLKYIRIKNLSDDTISVHYISTSIYSDSTESLCINRWSDWPDMFLKSKAECQLRIDWHIDSKYPHTHINHHYINYEHKFHSVWHQRDYFD